MGPARTTHGGRRGISRHLTAGLAMFWIPLTALGAAALGGFGVFRLHGMFDTTAYATNPPVEQIVSVRKTELKYELFGPENGAGMVSYLDPDGQPHQDKFSSLPWSITFSTTAGGVMGNVMGQGDTSTLGCRITVDGRVRDEKTIDGTNAAAFCVVKSS